MNAPAPLSAIEREKVIRKALVALGTDASYQAWIRTLPSIVNGKCDYNSTTGDIQNQSCHFRLVELGAGVAIKNDYGTLPMTEKEHREQHQIGSHSFFSSVWPVHQSEVDDRLRKILADHRREWCYLRLVGIVGSGQYAPVDYGEAERWARDVLEGDQGYVAYFMKWLRNEGGNG